jgi:ubiquinone/menaquinone biosynthesis C-methylase UbiE
MKNNIIYQWLRHVIGLGKIHKAIIAESDFAEGDKVIDVGCGPGMLLGTIYESFGEKIEYMGIDPDEKMLRYAQKTYGHTSIKFKRAFANHLPSVQDYYSHVLCVVSFHHFPKGEWKESLDELIRVLAPGGKLIIVEFGAPDGFIGHLLSIFNPCRKLARGLESFIREETENKGLILLEERKQFSYITHLVFTK